MLKYLEKLETTNASWANARTLRGVSPYVSPR
jgi:hypothetical protein